jgi:hypothetical protein
MKFKKRQKEARDERKILHYLDAPNLTMVLFKLHHKKLIGGFLLALVSDLINFTGPLLIRLYSLNFS